MKKICLKLVALILMLFMLTGCSNSKVENLNGNTTGNIIENYTISYSPGWLYFNDEIEGKEVFSRVSEDGLTYEVLNDSVAYYVNIIEDWIYYIDEKDDFIYKMKLDGTKRQAVIEEVAKSMHIYNGEIYYSGVHKEEEGIYKANLKGAKIKQLRASGNLKSVYGDRIYFFDDGIFMSMDLKGLNDITILNDYVNIAEIRNGWIYYGYTNSSALGGLNRCRLDGSEDEVLITEQADLFAVTNDYYYYRNTGYSSEISRMPVGEYSVYNDSWWAENEHIIGDTYLPGTPVLIGDYIYFSDVFYEEGTILGRMKIDGSEQTTLFSKDIKTKK